MEFDLETFYEHLKATSAEELFGKLGKKHRNYKRWAISCHPDANGQSELSKLCFVLLGKKAEEAVEPIVITSASGSYKIKPGIVAKGDIADIYLGPNKAMIFKIARSSTHEDMMKKEARILCELQQDADYTMSRFFPTVIDSFAIKKRNHGKKFVNALDYDEDYVTIKRVRQAHEQIDPRHLAWMLKRMLVALAWTHDKGYVHGAFVPDHFLVNKVDHGGRLIDWIHAEKIGGTVTTLSGGNRDFYAPEILNKEPVGPETDIYMAGKCALYLCGVNPKNRFFPNYLPTKIRNFLRSMVIENRRYRANDAWELHENLDHILKSVFGEPKYVELTGV